MSILQAPLGIAITVGVYNLVGLLVRDILLRAVTSLLISWSILEFLFRKRSR